MKISRVPFVALIALAVAPCVAQTRLKLPLDTAGITALNDRSKPGQEALSKIYEVKDFDKAMAMFPTLAAQHKDFMTSNNANANVAYMIGGLLRTKHPEAKSFDAQLALIDKSYKENLPPYALGYLAARMAPMLQKNDYVAEAKRYAEMSVDLYNQEDCLVWERYYDALREWYEQKKSKTPLQHVYYEADGVEHCDSDHADRIAELGKIEVKLGETKEAGKNFELALKLHPNMDAYAGLAAMEAAAGDKVGELRSLDAAALTGRLEAEDIAKAKAVYLELHPESSEAAHQALLDATYAKTFVNPVKVTPAVAAGPQHVVLEELFTGADCEPCTAPDLATEAALERYTREQMVLVVYHNNAPGPDPMTNDVGEDRAKYYNTHESTPHTFLNGKEYDLEEGLGTHAQTAYEELTSDVDKLLPAAVEGTLKIAATVSSGTVSVSVSGKPGKAKGKSHLQVLLLEDPVSYSGHNTLRMHPMVVRASADAKPGERGFALLPEGKIAHKVSFTLASVEQANLAYYAESQQALLKRLSALIASGSFDKKEVEKMGEFREHRNLIDPTHLAVVAFLQDDATKRVLTAVYAKVETK
jgi:tetratricopeptide (TPR) repeat protein